MRVLIVLFALCVLGRCQDRFDYLDEIEREVRSENNEITTEDVETIVKRDIWDDIAQEKIKVKKEYKKKLAACGKANNFVPYENCNLCKEACKDTGGCRSGQCGKICRADRKLIISKDCDLIVDKTALRALCKQVGNSGLCKRRRVRSNIL